MDVQLYIKSPTSDDYIQLDLYTNEKIDLNLSVKDLSDISKVRADFTQSFTIPASPTNNQAAQYW